MKSPSQYLDALIKELSRLPGIGPKSAARVAFHLLHVPQEKITRLLDAIVAVKEHITSCSICGGISDGEICAICADDSRDTTQVCVVEEQQDLLTVEKTGVFTGLYHVLNGVISPLDGIGPEDLAIPALLDRCYNNNIQEIILAMNPTIEGDATCLYLNKLLKPLGIKVMRIARGLPVGADLEYTDSATIAKSLKERVEVI
jgi:recombination protein RecR